MSEIALNVTTALARAAYGEMEDVAEFLATLDKESLMLTAVGLAVVGNAYLEVVSELADDPEEVRDKWLADLTDTARSP